MMAAYKWLWDSVALCPDGASGPGGGASGSGVGSTGDTEGSFGAGTTGQGQGATGSVGATSGEAVGSIGAQDASTVGMEGFGLDTGVLGFDAFGQAARGIVNTALGRDLSPVNRGFLEFSSLVTPAQAMRGITATVATGLTAMGVPPGPTDAPGTTSSPDSAEGTGGNPGGVGGGGPETPPTPSGLQAQVIAQRAAEQARREEAARIQAEQEAAAERERRAAEAERQRLAEEERRRQVEAEAAEERARDRARRASAEPDPPQLSNPSASRFATNPLGLSGTAARLRQPRAVGL